MLSGQQYARPIVNATRFAVYEAVAVGRVHDGILTYVYVVPAMHEVA